MYVDRLAGVFCGLERLHRATELASYLFLVDVFVSTPISRSEASFEVLYEIKYAIIVRFGFQEGLLSPTPPPISLLDIT